MWVLKWLWTMGDKEVGKQFAYKNVYVALETENPYNMNAAGMRNVKAWLGHPDRKFVGLDYSRSNGKAGHVIGWVTQEGADALSAWLSVK